MEADPSPPGANSIDDPQAIVGMKPQLRPRDAVTKEEYEIFPSDV